MSSNKLEFNFDGLVIKNSCCSRCKIEINDPELQYKIETKMINLKYLEQMKKSRHAIYCRRCHAIMSSMCVSEAKRGYGILGVSKETISYFLDPTKCQCILLANNTASRCQNDYVYLLEDTYGFQKRYCLSCYERDNDEFENVSFRDRNNESYSRRAALFPEVIRQDIEDLKIASERVDTLLDSIRIEIPNEDSFTPPPENKPKTKTGKRSYFEKPKVDESSEPPVSSALLKAFEILEIPFCRNLTTIKKAYFAKSLLLHPDRNTHDTTHEFQEMLNAYHEIISHL